MLKFKAKKIKNEDIDLQSSKGQSKMDNVHENWCEQMQNSDGPEFTSSFRSKVKRYKSRQSSADDDDKRSHH